MINIDNAIITTNNNNNELKWNNSHDKIAGQFENINRESERC